MTGPASYIAYLCATRFFRLCLVHISLTVRGQKSFSLAAHHTMRDQTSIHMRIKLELFNRFYFVAFNSKSYFLHSLRKKFFLFFSANAKSEYFTVFYLSFDFFRLKMQKIDGTL